MCHGPGGISKTSLPPTHLAQTFCSKGKIISKRPEAPFSLLAQHGEKKIACTAMKSFCLLVASTIAFGSLCLSAKEPVFDGLGSHTRKITTESAQAQKYFNQ